MVAASVKMRAGSAIKAAIMTIGVAVTAVEMVLTVMNETLTR